MKNYFNEKETACQCGCGMNVSPKLIKRLNIARELAGIPFTITSGARCPKHNKNIGASATSSHTTGLAVDIAATNSVNRFKIMEAIKEAGFNRIGVANNFIHVDIDKNKSQNVMWMY